MGRVQVCGVARSLPGALEVDDRPNRRKEAEVNRFDSTPEASVFFLPKGMTTIKIWIKKRTGKLVPVVIRPEEQLKAVLPLAKLRVCKLAKEGRPLDLEGTLADQNISDGDTLTSVGEVIFDRIHFQRPDGKQFEVRGSQLLLRRISSIKNLEIAPRTKVHPENFKLFMGCIELKDNKTLWDYNIEFGEIINVVY